MSESTNTSYGASLATGVHDLVYEPEAHTEISPFLRLPKEVRDNIYEHYFWKDSKHNEYEPETARIWHGFQKKPWTKASLLLTCKFVAQEGTTILYEGTNIVFDALECLAISPKGMPTAGMRLWFEQVGRTNLMKIRSITIAAKAYEWPDSRPYVAEGTSISIMLILHMFMGSQQIQSIKLCLSLHNFVVAGPRTRDQDICGMIWCSRVLHPLFFNIGPDNINECLRSFTNLTSLHIPYRTFRSAMNTWEIPKHTAIYKDFLMILEYEDQFLKVLQALLEDIEWRRLYFSRPGGESSVTSNGKAKVTAEGEREQRVGSSKE